MTMTMQNNNENDVYGTSNSGSLEETRNTMESKQKKTIRAKFLPTFLGAHRRTARLPKPTTQDAAPSLTFSSVVGRRANKQASKQTNNIMDSYTCSCASDTAVDGVPAVISKCQSAIQDNVSFILTM
jgi:hypothetical protein